MRLGAGSPCRAPKPSIRITLRCAECPPSQAISGPGLISRSCRCLGLSDTTVVGKSQIEYSSSRFFKFAAAYSSHSDSDWRSTVPGPPRRPGRRGRRAANGPGPGSVTVPNTRARRRRVVTRTRLAGGPPGTLGPGESGANHLASHAQ